MEANILVKKSNAEARMMQRYEAAMVLGAVGDALGYYHGRWEFERSGKQINEELSAMGGLEKLQVSGQKWIVSDDTVMHIATGNALVQHDLERNFEELFKKLATEYKACMGDMEDRAPGLTCIQWCEYIDPNKPKGWRIPFNPRGGGCGAAMRSMCIGLRYPHPDQLDDLIKVSIEAGRMTHHHPTGYLGSLASALFMSYAIQEKKLREWGAGLMEVVEKAREYIINEGVCKDDNLEHWSYFTSRWSEYLHLRNIAEGTSEPVFPEKYKTDVNKRDQFYIYISYGGWGGSSGHDAPLIAYDAVLACNGDWTTLCEWAMFHGGDSDSTGIIAGSLFGALYGFDGVPEGNHSDIEKREELVELGVQLYYLTTEKNGSSDCSESFLYKKMFKCRYSQMDIRQCLPSPTQAVYFDKAYRRKNCWWPTAYRRKNCWWTTAYRRKICWWPPAYRRILFWWPVLKSVILQ